ncbi:class I SAM-dependent methyltransferase [soil metagenome]
MSVTRRKPKGHRLFAALYDRLDAAAEKSWQGECRTRLLSEASGEIVEIGGGTGANLPHYRSAERVVVTEPDPYMRKKLRPKLSQSRVPVEVSEAGAQALPFADDSFDGVVSTLVLCTVPNQRVALAEIRRVLRPGGVLYFMEHVRGEGNVARWQDRIEPLWRRVAAGCRLNRDTVAAIEAAGFCLEKLERFEPPTPLSRFTPYVQGTAKLRAGS